jgi:PGF-pre-PGF domain-containing protein
LYAREWYTFTTKSSSDGGWGDGTVQNIPPTAEAGGPYAGFTGMKTTFTGSGADTDGTITGYRWDFNSDGTYDTGWSMDTTSSSTYPSAGEYTITLQVKDDRGAFATDTAIVTITIISPDQIPPTISNMYHMPKIPASDNSITIYATINDADGISSANVYWNDGSNHSKSMNKQPGSSTYSANIGQYEKDTTISYHIIAIDKLSNSNQSDTVSFTVKTPEPIITIENPGSNSVIYDNTPTIKAAYYDAAGINTNSIIFKLDSRDITINASINPDGIIYTPETELVLGSHALSLTVSDTLGNDAIKSWSFTIAESTSSAEKEIGEINPNVTKEIKIDEGTTTQTGIERINIKALNNLEKTSLFIAKLSIISVEINRPKITDTTIKNARELFIYSYLDIELISNGSKIKDTDVESITIKFKVEKPWIKTNNIDSESVKLLRYTSDGWQELKTTYDSEDENHVYYNTITKGLSILAVVGSEKIIQRQSEGVNLLLIIGVIVTIVIIVSVILFKTGVLYMEEEAWKKPRRKKRRKKILQKLKKPKKQKFKPR